MVGGVGEESVCSLIFPAPKRANDREELRKKRTANAPLWHLTTPDPPPTAAHALSAPSIEGHAARSAATVQSSI
ncbi:hypothetical protein LSTR_LSTR017672 [Laodelphax striatellus]|uniref:Uncharacterized protein n=1 Tax=Laodelphax striatellus TaxID=195883 RepID=A0A482XD36_LAOST|nr:hypothetical protein LSTR_LSTR017672 [Laodelphax striatellus]